MKLIFSWVVWKMLRAYENRDLVDSGKRTFKIKSRDGLPVVNKISWTKIFLMSARAVLDEAETIAI